MYVLSKALVGNVTAGGGATLSLAAPNRFARLSDVCCAGRFRLRDVLSPSLSSSSRFESTISILSRIAVEEERTPPLEARERFGAGPEEAKLFRERGANRLAVVAFGFGELRNILEVGSVEFLRSPLEPLGGFCSPFET